MKTISVRLYIIVMAISGAISGCAPGYSDISAEIKGDTSLPPADLYMGTKPLDVIGSGAVEQSSSPLKSVPIGVVVTPNTVNTINFLIDVADRYFSAFYSKNEANVVAFDPSSYMIGPINSVLLWRFKDVKLFPSAKAAYTAGLGAVLYLDLRIKPGVGYGTENRAIIEGVFVDKSGHIVGRYVGEGTTASQSGGHATFARDDDPDINREWIYASHKFADALDADVSLATKLSGGGASVITLAKFTVTDQDISTARAITNKAAQSDRENARALFSEAFQAIKARQIDIATAKLSSGLKIDPANYLANYYLAKCYEFQGKLDDAARLYELTHRLGGASVEATKASTWLAAINWK